MILDPAELKNLIDASSFDPASVDPLGYDIRLGEWVRLMSRGEKKDLLKDGDSVVIYPDETLLVISEEKICLPKDTFATGSPKMSLLLKGLWAHGGKTDFGYSSQLVFGFRHHGTEPITLRRGQRIFHLTFWRVHGQATKTGTNKVPDLPNMSASILDGGPKISSTGDERVMSRDGLQSYRLLKAVGKHLTRLAYAFSIVLALSAILITTRLLSSSWSFLAEHAPTITIGIGLLQLAVAILALPSIIQLFSRGN